jgi:hypothetical protein
MFIAVLFTTGKRGKQPKCPSVDEQANKMWYRYPTEMYTSYAQGGGLHL